MWGSRTTKDLLSGLTNHSWFLMPHTKNPLGTSPWASQAFREHWRSWLYSTLSASYSHQCREWEETFVSYARHLERTPGKRLCEEKAVVITEPAGSCKLRLASKAAMNKLPYVFKNCTKWCVTACFPIACKNNLTHIIKLIGWQIARCFV